MQGDIDDVSIGVELGHLYPVAHPDHVVRADLDGGHQGENGVLEHQHQHCRHGAEPGEQQQRRLVHQRRQHQDRGGGIDQQVGNLHIALDGPVSGIWTPLVKLVAECKRRRQGAGERQNDDHGT